MKHKHHIGEYVAHTSGSIGVVTDAFKHNEGDPAGPSYKVAFPSEETEATVPEDHLRSATHEEIEKATGGRP